MESAFFSVCQRVRVTTTTSLIHRKAQPIIFACTVARETEGLLGPRLGSSTPRLGW